MIDISVASQYRPQVESNLYSSTKYLSCARWSTYALVIEEALRINPETTLEIGPGPGIVTSILRKIGYQVKTLDLDPALKPDYLLSATDKNIAEKIKKVSLIIASEIFEHVRYPDFLDACRRLQSVTDFMILTLPDTNEKSLSFGIRLRLPLFNKISTLWKIRYGRVSHKFDGEHYWEIGKKGFPAHKIRKDIRDCGWIVESEHINPDNPYHRFFLLKKIH